ncbi:PREDICTED: GON-4-like protein [Amphimedon queenslandica]|uniref:Uncharacterized protein n=1 Tax=Amphimedon queenslandica TaxID=400682 RepID=A0AAN0JDI3_AMPQE|nr:PREDICTED: GON-4-like protein [Amphimedon queenslandica]|eukprot:XP_019855090.1 PREDICTED: GON-4-like protein [Amphimedon queenslandica]
MAEDKRERNSSRNLEEEKEDIDAKLEERAAQNNMTVANVKSLLHHVLKDKRVVAMAKKLANEDSSSEDIDLDIPPYEPRLTRARVREAVISSVTGVNFSPDKLSSLSVSTPLLPSISISSVAAPNALDELFPDVSSTEDEDDDYLPDTDTTVNNEDILVESDTETGDPIDTEIEEEEEEGEEEEGGERIQETQVTSSRGVLTDTDEAVQAATLLASLSDVNFTPLKDQAPLLPPIHPPVSTQPIQAYQPGPPELSNDEIIAKRTRSKRPLVDTDINEIEASFNPPDVPSDDESQTVQDIDEDELEWQKWLADLMNPRSADMSGLDDQEDDTEYNFWAEKHDDLEKEEFRTDRGVKIPQKEVDELIEELLNPNIGVLNADPNPIVSSLNYLDNTRTSTTTNNSGVDLTSAYLLESLGLRPPMLSQSALQATPLKDNTNTETRREEEQEMQTEPTTSSLEGNKEQGLSRDQMVQVWDQLQQHFQLLMQTFIMSRFEPSLVFIAQLAAQAVVSYE